MTRIEIHNTQSKVRVPRKAILELVSTILTDHNEEKSQLSVIVLNDRDMRVLHRASFGVDSTTDVISFPLRSDNDLVPEPMIGELYVSADVVHREATRTHTSQKSEFLLYVAHGVLHLLGHEDKTQAGKAAMRHLETRYVAPMTRFRPV